MRGLSGVCWRAAGPAHKFDHILKTTRPRRWARGSNPTRVAPSPRVPCLITSLDSRPVVRGREIRETVERPKLIFRQNIIRRSPVPTSPAAVARGSQLLRERPQRHEFGHPGALLARWFHEILCSTYVANPIFHLGSEPRWILSGPL